jgi:predicted ATPase
MELNKMELVYLWVEDYKNIHKQGFNFSPRFECGYNDITKELTIKENKDYIENFFGDNINVTAIVGKNGSGKSSVLNAIVNANEEQTITHLVVFKDDKGILSYSFNKKIHTNIEIEKKDIFPKLNIIIYLDRKNNDKLPINMGATRLSSDRNFKSAFTYYREIAISKNEIVNILVFELKIDTSFKLSTFMYLPNRVTIKLKTAEELISDDISLITKDNQLIEDYFISLSDIEHQLFIIEYLRKYDNKCETNIIKDKEKLKEKLEKKVLKEIIKLSKLQSTPKIEVEISTLTEDEKNLYIKEKGYFHYLNFDLIDKEDIKYNDLSHGEQNIFGQLLNIYFYTQKNDKRLFLFDEPEISLHPEWQRRYLDELIVLLKKREEKNYFIFTSHSPFLLSDLPKENVIFLDTYKKGEDSNQKEGNCKNVTETTEINPFGANIHTLLSDGFFMEDGLMGEFAKGKINKIKKFYEKVKRSKSKNIKKTHGKEYRKNIEDFKNIQKIIGEPFLKTIMGNYLDELYIIFSGENTLIDKELDDMKKRKVYLESLKNAKN